MQLPHPSVSQASQPASQPSTSSSSNAPVSANTAAATNSQPSTSSQTPVTAPTASITTTVTTTTTTTTGSPATAGATPQRRAGSNSMNPRDSHDVRLSKAMSWLLRHNAVQQGIKIRPDGYVKVDDMLNHPRFKGFTLADVQTVTNLNDKKRFQLLYEEDNDRKNKGKFVWYVKATQGHSLPVEGLQLEQVTDPSQIPVAIHGTFVNYWKLIKKSGLSKMQRNHIHMAAGMPNADGVVSGMRSNSTVYIHIDTAKAMANGVKFYKSNNGVILSDGRHGDGFIPVEFFKEVWLVSGEKVYPEA